MNNWIHRLIAATTLLLGSFSAAADESTGAGYVLYKALTRPSESSVGTILLCPHLSKDGDLYSIDPMPENKVSVLAKVEKSGACVPEHWESFVAKLPCLKESVTRALFQARSWNEQAGGNVARVVIVSTDPRVSLVKYGFGTQIARIARNLKIVAPSCHFRVEIRAGQGTETRVLAQENL